MSHITLEAVQEKQAELASMIQRLQDQAASAEQTQPDGSVRKVNVFRHAGFVDAA